MFCFIQKKRIRASKSKSNRQECKKYDIRGLHFETQPYDHAVIGEVKKIKHGPFSNHLFPIKARTWRLKKALA